MGAVGQGCSGFDAEKEAVGGVGGAEVFVGVERGEGFGVRDGEERAGDGWGGRVEDRAGVCAEIVEARADGGGAAGRETAGGGGDLAGRGRDGGCRR